jgi:hypothetical protein
VIRSLLLSALLLGTAPIAVLAQLKAVGKYTDPPALPANASNPLPQGCVKWTAQADIPVYDSWDHGQQLAQLVKGDQVTGITGAIITYQPSVIRVDSPQGKLKPGDRIWMYAYYGDGIADTWYKGQFHPKDDISFATWPDGSGCGGARCSATVIRLGIVFHWARIHLPSGKDGWVNMDTAKFDGVCQSAD